MTTVRCAQCGKPTRKEAGHVNRARRTGAKLFCDQRCFGLSRRKPKLPLRERKARKAAYDARRRVSLRDEIREYKRERYQLTRDPEKERRVRRRRRKQHVAYCRKYYSDPKRKAAKVRYDSKRRALIMYRGHREWAECHRLLVRLQKAIRKAQPYWYERAKERGYYENQRTVIERKRHAEISRW